MASHFPRSSPRKDPRSDIGLYYRPARAGLGAAFERQRVPRGRSEMFFRASSAARRFPRLVPIAAAWALTLSFTRAQRYPEARDEKWTSLLQHGPPRDRSPPRPPTGCGRLAGPPGRSRRGGATVPGVHQPRARRSSRRAASCSSAAIQRRWQNQPLKAVAHYRGLLARYPRTGEAPGCRAGLVRALLDGYDDFTCGGARGWRGGCSPREDQDATGSLALPTAPCCWRAMRVDANESPAEAHYAAYQLPSCRAAVRREPARLYVLVLCSGESLRQAGQATDARDRFDAVRQAGRARRLSGGLVPACASPR